MKYLSILILMSVSLIAEEAEVFPGSKISYTISSDWKVLKNNPPKDIPPTFRFSKEGIVFKMTFFPEELKSKPMFTDQVKIEEALLLMTKKFADGAVEKETVILKFKNHPGAYATFTDASMVGKTPGPGDFKTITSGLINIDKKAVANLTILTNDSKSKDFEEIVKMVENLTILK